MAVRATASLFIAVSLCVGATCLAVPVPAGAQGAQQRGPTDELERIGVSLGSGDLKAVLSRLDAYLRKPRATVDRTRAHLLRGLVLLAMKREAEALTAYAQAGKAMPDNPAIPKMQFEHAVAERSLRVASVALERLINAFPDVARTLSNEHVFALLRDVREQKRQDAADALILELAGIGFGDWEARPSLAVSAARILLARGKVDEAAALMAPVVSRDLLETALVQKRFAPLWAKLEAQAGPHMERAEAAAVLAAEREVAEQPDDVVAQRGLVHALREARRYDEADAAAKGFAATPDAMRALEEPAGWLINEHALVLHAAGRADDADARFAAMRDIDIEKKPWLINMVINRAELLVQDGKYARAEPLLAEAGPLAEKHGSPYARQLIRRLKVCTTNGLSRTAEVPALVAAMAAHPDDAASATVEGFICLGRLDDAEKIVAARLADPEKAEDFIKSLQREPLGSGDPSRWTKGWAQLRSRPAVQAAFERVGRDLPATMRPATTRPEPIPKAR